jgi:hypothetical protein
MKNPWLAGALAIALAGCAAGQANEPAVDDKAVTARTNASAGDPAPAGVAPAAASDARPEGAAGAAADPTPADDTRPAWREITIPAGTTLPLTLRTSVASDTSNVEDPVRATLRRPISVDGVEVLPTGTVLTGHVTDAARSAKVKGRARIGFRFTRLDPPGDTGTVNVRTSSVSRVAPATKKRDTATIGGSAVGGAIVGGIIGGGDGAAKGAVIGGAGGTAAVLATRGKEVRLAAGSPVTVKLSAPVTLRVPVK